MVDLITQSENDEANIDNSSKLNIPIIHYQNVSLVLFRVSTNFTFFSDSFDRLVYMILRGQIGPKHEC